MQVRYLQVCGQVSTLTDTTTLTLTGSGSISHFMCLSAFCGHKLRQTGSQRNTLLLPWRRAPATYLDLVDGVDDDHDVAVVTGRQALQPAREVLQDLTGLHGETRHRPQVLQQLQSNTLVTPGYTPGYNWLYTLVTPGYTPGYTWSHLVTPGYTWSNLVTPGHT